MPPTTDAPPAMPRDSATATSRLRYFNDRCTPVAGLPQSTGAIVMAITAEDFYRSSNGDRWQLIRDTASGRTFVRHEPNLSSGR